MGTGLFQLSINSDPLYKSVVDRLLPQHPCHMVEFPYWFQRKMQWDYGSPRYDLPTERLIRRHSEHNERCWHQVSYFKGIPVMERFFPVGALFPLHPIFLYHIPPLSPASEVVKGEKLEISNEPWAFKYID